MTKILTLEQLTHIPFEELISLYQQGYRLNENTSIYPKIDDIVPHSRSNHGFA